MLATPQPERQAHRQIREGLILRLAKRYRSSLALLHLLATFHTGALLSEEVGFPIERFGSRLEVGDREQPSL
ncbi:MAG TPA: hypothetical protein VI411_11070 [Actinomycetota bacterium]